MFTIFIHVCATFHSLQASKELLKGRSSEEQRAVVKEILLGLLPNGATTGYRSIVPPNK